MTDQLPADGRRILLTGATGRVGARFLPVLRKLGADVRLAVWNPQQRAAPSPGRMVIGDLTDAGVCAAAVDGMDVVVHIASAFTGLTPQVAEELNYAATTQLATCAAEAGVSRFVQLSSYLVYAPGNGQARREHDSLRTEPGTAFAAAKLGSERAAAGMAGTGSGLAMCVLRVGFTYGEGDPHLAEAFDWARRRRDGTTMPMVHHADLRQGVLRAVAERAAGVFNIADAAPTRADELARIADEVQAARPQVAEAEFDAEGSAMAVDTGAARRVLGFSPVFPSVADAHRLGKM